MIARPVLPPILLLTVWLAGCGGDGIDASSVAPASPAATASPAPSSTPSPLPSPSPGPFVAGAKPGETIGGPLACSDGEVTRNSDGSVSGIGPISRTKIDNVVTLLYRAPDTFSSDVNGFGGSTWQPTDKRAAPNRYFVRYANPSQGELQLGSHDGLTFVTYGLENGSGLCFFAAGIAPETLPTDGRVDYWGAVDGFAVILGQPKRLFELGYDKALLDMDFGTGRGTLQFEIFARNDPFGDFEKSARESLGTVTANLQLSPGSKGFGLTALSGAGLSGQVTGQFVDRDKSVLGTGGAGVALVFELTRPNGDILYGSVAVAANLI